MPDMQYLNVGDKVLLELPFSEVCMHMKVAGRQLQVEVVDEQANGHLAAQIYDEEGHRFSFPITLGEAGLHRDAHGVYAWVPKVVAPNPPPK